MKRMEKSFGCILTLILMILTRVLPAQGIQFEEVVPPQGRAFQHVTGISQAPDGKMWFSTKAGLFSYDGYEMKSYRYSPFEPNSLSSDQLDAVYAGPDGRIWIGTIGSGLDCLDPQTGIFTHFRSDTNEVNSPSSDHILTILGDRDGMLWLGTTNGLDRLDPASQSFTHFRTITGDSTSLSYNVVGALYEDAQGTLWVGTGTVYGEPDFSMGGLNRLDKKTGTFTRYKANIQDEHALINNKVTALFEDHKGTFWIGTAGDGLHSLDRSTGVITRYPIDPDHPEKWCRPPINKQFASTDFITFIREDMEGGFWIGTSESGLNYYDPAEMQVHHLEVETRENGYSARTTWKAYTSREGVLWISSLSGELFQVDPHRKMIPHFKASGVDWWVNGFYEWPDGALWIAFDEIYAQNDTRTDLVNRINAAINQFRVPYRYVIQIHPYQKELWVVSSSGLIRLNTQTNEFTHFFGRGPERDSLTNPFIFQVYIESEQQIWLGTFNGLNLFNPESGKITRYYINPMDLKSLFGINFINSILKDRDNRYWVGTAGGGGLYLFDPVKGTFKKYLDVFRVMVIFEDSKGTLWAGSTDGLYQYDPKSDSYFRYADRGGNSIVSEVNSMVEDQDHYLWLGTGEGIVRMDSSRTEFKIFGKNYGVDGSKLNYHAAYVGHDNKLYFGERNGFYAFYPSDFKIQTTPPQITFSGFHLLDSGDSPTGKQDLQAMNQGKPVRLNFNQNTFSIDFLSIDYCNPEENQQFYFLEGYDAHWRNAGKEHQAIYYNLPPNDYRFKVKAANAYGIWTEKEFPLTVLPPWWKTWWAYTFYGVIFLCVLSLIHRYQRERVLRVERERNKDRELAQAREIEKAYTELKSTQAQLIQSEKMASLGELTAGIAHEIQNPLNFVNNFSEVNQELSLELEEELLAGKIGDAISLSKDIKENSEKINQHGKRAEAIVKSMLQHSRTSTGEKELTDINALCDEYLRLAYHGLRAKDKNFNADLRSEFDPDLPKMRVMPQDIGRVLLNIINNGFQALQGVKNPVLSISTKRSGDQIEITIADNGPGIPDEIKDKIFQPFFTTKPTGQGTGLGLSLAYDIVKAHGGEMEVESESGRGAKFMVRLPVV
ncbi:MAG: GHKL domain-containing protein [Saprospiraceae bacterium]|nr:GHKL domain-containing protein [Saprospiraceae bacterium]